MKQRQLEMLLQSAPGHPAPTPELEQYLTPAVVAAAILYDALAAGHIHDRCILDLGCGTGIFAIGAVLLGARCALGVDKDEASIELAKRTWDDIRERTSELTGKGSDLTGKGTCEPGPPGQSVGPGEVKFVTSDVGNFHPEEYPEYYDRKKTTVVMNPPFGAQRRHADRLFLDRAAEFADVVYSMHKAETGGFVCDYMGEKGMYLDYRRKFNFIIPYMFEFHLRERMPVDVVTLGFSYGMQR